MARATPRGSVCMVVHSYYPIGEPRAEKEARAAIEAGYDLSVICLRRPSEPASEVIDSVRIVRLPVQHAPAAGMLSVLREYLAFTARATVAVLKVRTEGAADIVYVHGPPDFLMISALLPRMLGGRTVFDIHDLSPHMLDARYGDRKWARPVIRALQAVEVLSTRIADEVVTVHEPYRAELVSHGVDGRKISVVMNSPDLAEIERARDAATATSGGVFTVAYHGTINEWYGVDLIVDALARLGGRICARALILGEGDALPMVIARAEALGVASRMEFSEGFVPHVEALERVSGASCGVIPNRSTRLNRFALSSKLLEYVELGIPVVVARLETLAAHFSSDEVTFFDAGDPESLAQAIAWVAENPADAAAKAARARARAEAYSWPASRRRLLAVLDRLSRTPPRGRPR